MKAMAGWSSVVVRPGLAAGCWQDVDHHVLQIETINLLVTVAREEVLKRIPWLDPIHTF